MAFIHAFTSASLIVSIVVEDYSTWYVENKIERQKRTEINCDILNADA